MPIFQYNCPQCGKDHEILVRAAEKPKCPACGSPRLVKQVSAFAAVTPSAKDRRPAPSCASCCERGSGSCPYT